MRTAYLSPHRPVSQAPTRTPEVGEAVRNPTTPAPDPSEFPGNPQTVSANSRARCTPSSFATLMRPQVTDLRCREESAAGSRPDGVASGPAAAGSDATGMGGESATAPLEGAGEPRVFGTWLASLRAEEGEAERLFRRVASGEPLDTAELLRLQVSVARVALRVEMGSRVVDRALQGVRQLTAMQL